MFLRLPVMYAVVLFGIRGFCIHFSRLVLLLFSMWVVDTCCVGVGGVGRVKERDAIVS